MSNCQSIKFKTHACLLCTLRFNTFYGRNENCALNNCAASAFLSLCQVTSNFSLRKLVHNYHVYYTEKKWRYFNKYNLAWHSEDNKLNICHLTVTINRPDCSLYCCLSPVSQNCEQNKPNDSSVHLWHSRQKLTSHTFIIKPKNCTPILSNLIEFKDIFLKIVSPLIHFYIYTGLSCFWTE